MGFRVFDFVAGHVNRVDRRGFRAEGLGRDFNLLVSAVLDRNCDSNQFCIFSLLCNQLLHALSTL